MDNDLCQCTEPAVYPSLPGESRMAERRCRHPDCRSRGGRSQFFTPGMLDSKFPEGASASFSGSRERRTSLSDDPLGNAFHGWPSL